MGRFHKSEVSGRRWVTLDVSLISFLNLLNMPKNFTILLFSSALLYGCAAPPKPYSLPDGVPSANLKSAIDGAYGRSESIDISLFDGSATPPVHKSLFSIRRSISKPEGYVQVPANTPLTISYYESASAGRYCELSIKVILEPQKNYSLTGGFAYEKGPIPILTGTRQCQFGAIDDETKMPIRIR
jgi:hypothetical protein